MKLFLEEFLKSHQFKAIAKNSQSMFKFWYNGGEIVLCIDIYRMCFNTSRETMPRFLLVAIHNLKHSR